MLDQKQWHLGPFRTLSHKSGTVLEAVVHGELLRQAVIRRSFAGKKKPYDVFRVDWSVNGAGQISNPIVQKRGYHFEGPALCFKILFDQYIVARKYMRE